MTPQELKESIILSAMQGKLVNQIDSEESSVALLDRIAVEQSSQIKAKKAKASKAEIITEEDIPFDIPSSWSWIRFGNLVSYNMGKTPPRAEAQWWGVGVPWVSIADMPESGHILATRESVTHEAISGKFSGRISKAGTLLMSFKLTVGRVSILDIDAVHNEAIISIYPYADEDEIIKKYLFAILPYVAQSGDSKNAIKGKTLNDTSISNLLIPLPPIAEQKRIVDKLEEMLPLIERYEATWNKLEEFNKRFPGDMQKSILQLAIQGKLVEQRPGEGTGEELFQQIQAEKQALIKAGKIKKEKPLPEIAVDEIPFDIPESWKWVRFAELMDSMSTGPFGSMLHKSDYVPKGIPLVNPANIVKGKIVASDKMLVSTETAKRLESYVLRTGMIIMGRRGEMGRCAVVSEKENGWLCGTGSFFMMPSSCVFVHYLSMFFSTPYAKTYLSGASVGTTMSNLNHKILSSMPVPLPPLAEHKRIVAKLEEILPLCERLK